MRPFRSFLLLLIFLACFAGLSYLIPLEGYLPGISDIIPEISLKRDQKNEVILPDASGIQEATVTSPASDSLSKPVSDRSKKVLSFPESVVSRFDSIRSVNGQIRIMYYGDSQIEGDRITSYLRSSLRERYGGTGPGLFLPVMPVMYTKTLNIRSSDNWRRYNYLSYRDSVINYNSLGPFMTICRYLGPEEVTPTEEYAFVGITPSVYSDSSALVYKILRVFYGNVSGPVILTIKEGDIEIASGLLNRVEGISEFRCRLNNPGEILLEFMGKSSPDIYGLSIEDSAGLVLDNIPQRGSAGLEFTMVDRNNLEESFRLIDPDMFILHYGLNIVRNESRSYDYYKSGLLRQLMLLKELNPRTPILVMSLTDIARAEGDSLISYPNIESIRDAQRTAALQAGEGFWDTWDAMGGRNSIVNWSRKIPPLANNDYVHLSYPGADTLAKFLLEDIFPLSGRQLMAAYSLMPPDTLPASRLMTDAPSESYSEDSILVRLISSLLSYNPDNPFIFTTVGFWIFLLIMLAGYSIVYKRIPLRNVYLFLISLYFYFKAGGLFLFLLIFVTAVDYACGLLISRYESRSKRKFFIILSLVSNLGLLAYFKYADFFAETVNTVFGTNIRVFDLLSALSNSTLGTSFDTSFIILPVGISFFTFQSLSYTIDVYRRKMAPVRSIIDFGFYVSFFPHLVAGPIVRASVFMPQVYQEFNLSRNEFSHALFMISKGLIKKILISNFIAVNFVDRVFDAPAVYSGFENLMAVYGYGLQIYCDFSGYTDIAIGVALILGFRLPVNFNSPYKASSITDFWKRWHISLSRWLKDYLYISLGGNRKGKIRTYFNLMITMLLGGLWHGAALRFIIWGGLHGLGLVFDRLRQSLFGEGGRMKWLIKITGIILTFHFVNFCWIFFRSETMDNAFIMIRQMFYSFSPGSYLNVLPAYGAVFILILTGYIIHFLPEEIKEAYRAVFIKVPVAAQMFIIMIVAVVLFQMRNTGAMPFIYFRF